jgi:hypothetical protein
MEYALLLHTVGSCSGYSLAGVPPFANVLGTFAMCGYLRRQSHTNSSSSSC